MTYIVLIFSAVFAVFVRVFFVDVYKAPSQSMAPAILKGEHIISLQSAYGFYSPITEKTYFKTPPKVGELVVYEKNRKTFIKRIAAGPGQSIELKNGILSVDSRPCALASSEKTLNSPDYVYKLESCPGVSERIIISPTDSAKAPSDFELTRLSEEQYFVISDNRSTDPANVTWELIRSDEIVGKPYLIWLSYSSTQDFISESKGFRWNRFLTKVN